MRSYSYVPSLTELKGINPKLKAVLFDMDGTLLNTEFVHHLAVKEIAQNYPHHNENINLLEVCLGTTDRFAYDSLAFKNISFLQFIQTKNLFIIQYLKNYPENIISKEILNFLKECQENKIKMAIVTSSEKNITFELLKKLEIDSFFDQVITREDTTENKPSPMPYLEMLKKLNISAEEAFIFEDSPPGIAAAIASTILFAEATWYPALV